MQAPSTSRSASGLAVSGPQAVAPPPKPAHQCCSSACAAKRTSRAPSCVAGTHSVMEAKGKFAAAQSRLQTVDGGTSQGEGSLRRPAVVDPSAQAGLGTPHAAPSAASVSTSFSHGTPELAACCRRRPGAPVTRAPGGSAGLHPAPAAHSNNARATRRRIWPARRRCSRGERAGDDCKRSWDSRGRLTLPGMCSR